MFSEASIQVSYFLLDIRSFYTTWITKLDSVDKVAKDLKSAGRLG